MCPTRISVCTAPGLSTTTTRRVGGGGSGSSIRARPLRPRAEHPLAPRTPPRVVTSPTIARMQLFGAKNVWWNATRSSRVIAGNRLGCAAVRHAVRMESVDRGDRTRRRPHSPDPRSLTCSARQRLLPLAIDLLGRERRVAHDVGHQVERRIEAVLHHDGVDEGQVGAGARAQPAANVVERVGNLARAPRGRALIEQRRHQRGHAGLARRILCRAGAHEQADADRRLLVVQHRHDLQAVGERAHLVRRELDVARGERARWPLAGQFRSSGPAVAADAAPGARRRRPSDRPEAGRDRASRALRSPGPLSPSARG